MSSPRGEPADGSGSPPRMLPPDRRLRSNRDFQRVYRAGRGWSHPLLSLQLLPQPTGKRLGISVSKKVGGAVCRNRIRRRIREIARAGIENWKDGFDGVVVVRPPAATADFAALTHALTELVGRARLVREPLEPQHTPFSLPGRPSGTERQGATRNRARPVPASTPRGSTVSRGTR
jgi:ribonuclease P protein component